MNAEFYQNKFLPSLKHKLGQLHLERGIAVLDSCRVHLTEGSLNGLCETAAKNY